MRGAAAVMLGVLATRTALAATGDVHDVIVKELSSSDGSSGTIEGLPATLRVDTHGRFHDQATTMLNIELATPELRLIAHRPYPNQRAPAVDVPTNDPGFDAAYVVEGAPNDLVRALLDEPLRQALMASDGAILAVDGNWLSVSRDGPLQTADEAQRLITVAKLAAHRLNAGLIPATPLTAAERQKELTRYQASRDAQQRGAIASVIPAFIAGLLLLGALFWRIRRRR